MERCPQCVQAEATRWERLAGWLLDKIDRPSPAARMFSAYGQAFRAAVGMPAPTWYEKHRQEWIRTGDDRELTRMLRHVQP